MEFFDIRHIKPIEELSPPISDDPSKISWMAGIFDGEGSVSRPTSRTAGKNYHSGMRIKISMCDLDTLEKFILFSGGGTLTGPHKPNGLGKNPFYAVSISSHRAYQLLEKMWEWLSHRRKQQAYSAILLWSVMEQTKHGVKIKPEDIPYIKSELEKGGHGVNRRLALKYNVTDAMISAIKKGRAWKD